MKNPRNWLILLIASAIAGTFAIQSCLNTNELPASPPPTHEGSTARPRTETPPPPPTFGQCAFVWAYKDIPKLTEKLNSSVKALDPSATARAEAFGEDCIYEDGQKVFGAMETDFYVYLPTPDLTNEKALGNWMAEVIPLVLQLPAEELQGPMPGFVEFWFTKSDTEQVIVRVPIQQYKEQATDKTGAELFRLFYIPPIAPT